MDKLIFDEQDIIERIHKKIVASRGNERENLIGGFIDGIILCGIIQSRKNSWRTKFKEDKNGFRN